MTKTQNCVIVRATEAEQLNKSHLMPFRAQVMDGHDEMETQNATWSWLPLDSNAAAIHVYTQLDRRIHSYTLHAVNFAAWRWRSKLAIVEYFGAYYFTRSQQRKGKKEITRAGSCRKNDLCHYYFWKKRMPSSLHHISRSEEDQRSHRVLQILVTAITAKEWETIRG